MNSILYILTRTDKCDMNILIIFDNFYNFISRVYVFKNFDYFVMHLSNTSPIAQNLKKNFPALQLNFRKFFLIVQQY